MRLATYISTFIGGLIVAYLMFSLGVVDRLDGIPGTQAEPMLSLPTYLSFLSAMLTAVTAVLAAVAIFIGIVAAMTFRDLSDKAEQVAQRRLMMLYRTKLSSPELTRLASVISVLNRWKSWKKDLTQLTLEKDRRIL